ncbi:hypothetical protein LMH87_011887 [Akanthomyces muscarius]|uniref:Uncharacterized protein n=1 Tax=Akanthomyces muscarius TaxID=2231603 RepID=A0A9W8QC81_AKAMU|nr:hypothetical protein LMH87_011887 [Akanthomyces muscarius]KAJ4151172.1 hypothetical protein LMH87_011887 [Akanthomyces muscarius]
MIHHAALALDSVAITPSSARLDKGLHPTYSSAPASCSALATEPQDPVLKDESKSLTAPRGQSLVPRLAQVFLTDSVFFFQPS